MSLKTGAKLSKNNEWQSWNNYARNQKFEKWSEWVKEEYGIRNDPEERVNNIEESMFKVKDDPKETYEYQTDPDYVNDSLTDIRNKLTELEDWSRRNNIRIDGIAEEPEETWEQCDKEVQHLLNEELDI